MTANILTHKFNSFTSWTDHTSSRVSSHEARKNKTALKNTSRHLATWISLRVRPKIVFNLNLTKFGISQYSNSKWKTQSIWTRTASTFKKNIIKIILMCSRILTFQNQKLFTVRNMNRMKHIPQIIRERRARVLLATWALEDHCPMHNVCSHMQKQL